MKFYSLPRAFVRETSKRIKENFDLIKFVKNALSFLNVPFVDDCCEAETPATHAPVRYNLDTEVTEFYNPETKAWEATA